jgi:ferric-dicitrate binding protein FerR (iron transport regulator)
MTDQPSDNLLDLFDDYLDDRLDAVRLGELEASLRADPEARAVFVRYCRLHTDLHLDARASQAGARALRRLAGAEATTSVPGAEPAGRRQRWGWALLTAALVLLAVGLAGWFGRQRGPVPEASGDEVAWLVNAQDCQWADGTPPTGEMRPGTLLCVERGLAEVRFRSGVHVVLQGPARLELLSGNSAHLHSGRLTARVPSPATGFTVLSPQGKVVDLGTEFGMSVGADGAADVYVFEGKVEASAQGPPLGVTRDQVARIAAGTVAVRPDPPRDSAGQFIRAIVPPPVIVPRTLTLDFRRPAPGSLVDGVGQGTGLTLRLPGTGRKLPERDTHLRLDPNRGLLLTTTNSDLNTQYMLDQGEYLGVRLADLGFTGKEDFAVTMTVPDVPALELIGQFGLYAGVASDRNIRGGIFSPAAGQYTQNLVNNHEGIDRDSHLVGLGLVSPGDEVRLTLRRLAGKYSLTAENQSRGGSTTLTTRHPAFLDDRADLTVGLFGANTRSNSPKTLVIRDLTVTVWTTVPRP